MPSAEQADNRRRGRAEDRIRQITQDRIGLLTLTVWGTKPPGLGRQPRAATTSAPDSSRSAHRSGWHKIDCGGPGPCRSSATTSD
jgi:hypothetical protein